MAKRSSGSTVEVELDENKLRELEDVARGCEGSQGDISLSPEHAEIFSFLGGNDEMLADTGAGGVIVPCEHLCEVVLGEVVEPKNDEVSRRRRLMGAKPTRATPPHRERRAGKKTAAEKAEEK